MDPMSIWLLNFFRMFETER